MRRAKTPVEIINDLITSKEGYIRYLRNRVADPAPLYAEIERHREHIATHEAAIAKIEDTLANVSGALATAECELKELREKKIELQPSLETKAMIQEKINRLQERLNALQ